MASTTVLKTVVFMGSAKNALPPWGGDKRLGDRVLAYVTNHIKSRKTELGDTTVTHEVTVYDPIDVFGEGGALAHSGGHLTVPHFFMKRDDAPAATNEMADTIKAADAIVVVTAEYNHSAPPALTSLLGHFGGSNYSMKPSAIVTYSPGPFAGMRAAIALRPILSELGAIPVSKLCGFPDPNALFESDGTPKDAEARMLKQLPGLMGQLEWMAVAMKKQRELCPQFPN
eukprot:GFYU01013490.1.p2 GENE.GFYU01013490.1~~GFYU01013490.1.p2  ORF type:complete len:257 (+),score=92.61 GFYU01013490.1:88-771(+)